MRRRRSKYRSPASPSLFPFLAVLICTMGVLIVLLVLGVQQAQVAARDLAEDTSDRQLELLEAQQEQQLDRDEYIWRNEVLAESRQDKTDKLADSRLALSHLEQHIRQLENHWKKLVEQQRQLGSQLDPSGSSAQRTAQLEQLRVQVERARQLLEEARQRFVDRQGTYALVPYKGPNGTNRYPIYLECRPEGVVIQPEGTLVSLVDLQQMSGPGNPLDACLRAIREHLFATVGAQSIGEPYPLLVVRPDAVRAYALARHAMTDWEDAFGYELLSAEIQLSYPQADPELARLLERTIVDARQRQQALAQAMPSRFGGGNGLGSGLSQHGPSGQAGAPGPTSAQPTLQQPGQRPGQRPGQQGGRQTEPGSQSPAPQSGADGGPGGAAVTDQDVQARPDGWGLPRRDAVVTGITRPIYVSCYANKLVIVPRRGERGRTLTLNLSGPLSGQVDEFVGQLWKHMESWGIAVAGGHWRPVVKIEVFPGGATRFVELGRLLKRSGFVVQQYR